MSSSSQLLKPVTSSTSSSAVLKTITGSHTFVIEGYSLLKGMGVGRSLKSSIFHVAGYDWALYFYPDGQNAADNSMFVSVFLAMESEAVETRAMFELRFLDQSGKEMHANLQQFEPFPDDGPDMPKYGMAWGHRQFISKEILEGSDCLKDDRLMINCTVRVVETTHSSSKLHSVEVPDSTMASDIGGLLENLLGSDITFNVNEEKFHAHKLILAAHSTILRSEYFGDSANKDREIIVTNLRPEVFKAMLHFVYKDILLEDESMASTSGSSDALAVNTLAAKLLAAANHYGFNRLKHKCEARLSQDICVNSVARILVLAEQESASKLKAACLRFAAYNLIEVVRSDGFKQLKEEGYSNLQLEVLEECGKS